MICPSLTLMTWTSSVPDGDSKDALGELVADAIEKEGVRRLPVPSILVLQMGLPVEMSNA